MSDDMKSYWVGDVEVYGEKQDTIDIFAQTPESTADHPKYVNNDILKERAKAMREFYIAQGVITPKKR